MTEENGSLRPVRTCTRSAATRVTEIETFQPLCPHDVIISSIYNAQDKANTVWDRRQRWSASWNADKHYIHQAVSSNSGKSLQLPGDGGGAGVGGGWGDLHKRHDWKKKTALIDAATRRAAAALCETPRRGTPKEKHNNTQAKKLQTDWQKINHI